MSSDAGEGDMPIPTRKTRRVRDPYAIDVSDEELEDHEELAPSTKKRVQTQEESLIDFLNNYAPPPEPPTQSFNLTQTSNKPKKKASAPSLMARLTRRDSGNIRAASSRVGQVPAASRSLSSRASSGRGGHIPIQVNAPALPDQYAPQNRAGFSKTAPIINGGPAPAGVRVAMKKFEAREAVPVSSRATSDLAEFFKHSGPPPGMAPMVNQFPGPPERGEPSSMSKVFGRRKKASFS